MFAASTMAAFAQVSSSEQTIKPTLDISTNGMSLTKNSEEMPLLTVYDEEVVEKDKTPTIDINQHQFSTKNLAAIIGVKPKQVKTYRIRITVSICFIAFKSLYSNSFKKASY